MIRGIITSCIEGVIKRFSASGRTDETFADREYFQHYGYTSRPKPGAEVIIIREGNHIIAIGSDDRRYRIALEEGAVAIYDDLGQKVHLQRDKIEIVSPTKVLVTAPIAEFSGNIIAHGDITDQSATGGRSMAGMRQVYDSHTHPEHDGGNTSAPNQGM